MNLFGQVDANASFLSEQYGIKCGCGGEEHTQFAGTYVERKGIRHPSSFCPFLMNLFNNLQTSGKMYSKK